VSLAAELLAGGLLMLAALIKVIPVLFLVPPALRGRWRVLVGAGLTFLLVFGVGGSLYFGPRQNLAFHQRWLDVSLHGTEGRPQDPRQPDTMRGSTRLNNQSLEAVLARLTMPLPADRKKHPFTVNVVSWDAAAWRRTRDGLTLVITLGFIAGLLWGPRPCAGARGSGDEGLLSLRDPGLKAGATLPASDAASVNSAQTARDYALMAVLALSISPIVWSHYYVWLFVPLVWLGTWGGRSGRGVVALWIAAELAAAIPWCRAIGVSYAATLAVGVALAANGFVPDRRGPD
jgi:hypothetical protein